MFGEGTHPKISLNILNFYQEVHNSVIFMHDPLPLTVLKNFATFTGKHLCWSFLLIKLQAGRPVTFFKKRLQHRCFPLNIAKSFRHYLQIEVKLNLSKVCKSPRVSEGATFSNTAQTRLLLCKFPDELHFWVTNFEIQHIFLVLLWQWVIYIPLCFKRNLFVKQNILILLFNLELTPCVTKTSHI